MKTTVDGIEIIRKCMGRNPNYDDYVNVTKKEFYSEINKFHIEKFNYSDCSLYYSLEKIRGVQSINGDYYLEKEKTEIT